MNKQKELALQLKNKLAQAKIATYTATSSQIAPHLKNYWLGLREIWNLPKYKNGNANQDYEILAKYNLGKINRYFGTSISSYQYWDWNYELKQLNKQIFQLKIG